MHWTTLLHVAHSQQLLRVCLATVAVVGAAFVVYEAGHLWITHSGSQDHREQYRRRKSLLTIVSLFAAALIVIDWAQLLSRTGTFLGLIGAGVAVALRDPLMSVAGRIAILAGKMYTIGDRIEINKMKGDVIDVGFFYTRLMEIGNWVHGDQYSGRIIQFSNSQLFGASVFNYTRHFGYIWDEARLPITYRSNIPATIEIMKNAGMRYTRHFLAHAQTQLQAMQRYFVVPDFELEPNVYVKVTSNWIELTMRYVVDPKQRRTASTFIYREMFTRLAARKDIWIASSTQDLTVHTPNDDDLQVAMAPNPAPSAQARESRPPAAVPDTEAAPQDASRIEKPAPDVAA
jgi:small-conductance mechanosensitive channel